MLHVVLCDDESLLRDQLKDYLKRLEEDLEEQFQIREFSSGEELLTYYPHETDILLLDIEMGSPDGLETARQLRATAPDLCIIFITSYAQYALKSYSVRAFGFLPKPVSYLVFRNEMALAVEQLRRRSSHFVLIKDREEGAVYQVDVKDIRYFEAQDHDIFAVTEKQRLYYRGTLTALEQKLAPYGFFRCHAAFLVNQRYIASIGQDLTLAGGTIIPVSRSKRKEFLTNLSGYVGEML